MKPSSSDIDVIITYVNSSDQSWVRDYIRVTKTYSPSQVRFRSWNTLKYLLRGIAVCMPFVRQVILVVAKPSQVPVWVNQENVRIVYHEDYIPKRFLPTFNSCTIESYFWNIPDLADKIIYFNDDMFPITLMREDNFFTENTPHLKFTEPEYYSLSNMFRVQCRSSINLITKALKLPAIEIGTLFRPYHITTAFTKNTLNSVGELCESSIATTVTKLRQKQNVNQYIYAYYHYFTNDYVDETINYKYFEISNATIDAITDEIEKGEFQMICLNDSDRVKDYTKLRSLLIQSFDRRFPDKCKYEN